jgi:hypothetical protein
MQCKQLFWTLRNSFFYKLYPQDNVEEVILLKYVKDQETNVLSNVDRIRLEMDMFALAFDPVNDRDEGRYLCLINNRPLPDAVIKLNVLGKSIFIIVDSFFSSQYDKKGYRYLQMLQGHYSTCFY